MRRYRCTHKKTKDVINKKKAGEIQNKLVSVTYGEPMKLQTATAKRKQVCEGRSVDDVSQVAGS